MPEQHSGMHSYVNWTKQRLDEMDATLASLEAKAGHVKADAKAKADQTLADLKKQREEFATKVKSQAHASEAAWQAGKTQLETQWNSFEKEVKAYFETVGKHVEQQQATFRDAAASQMKAWHEATDKLQQAAAKVATDHRAKVDAALKQMKTGAAEAEAHLQKLKQAGNESWAALSAALAESRKAFDKANQKAVDELHHAAPPKA